MSLKAFGPGFGTVTWIVDATKHNRLFPVGVAGELIREGPAVALSYLKGAPTKAPAWRSEGPEHDCEFGCNGRLYKTGDLVRYEADGFIVFVGCRDGQVKIRGQRIGFGEIEHHLRQLLPAEATVAVDVAIDEHETAKPSLATSVLFSNAESGYERSRHVVNLISHDHA